MANRETMSSSLSSAAPSGRILVVDDEPLIAATLAEFLHSEGFQVFTAELPEAALTLAHEQPLDVLICDVQLPGLSGVDLMERLLQIQPSLLAMLITAYGTVETAIQAFQRGAQDYLLKPLRFEEVLRKIRHLIRFRQLMLDNQWLRRELNRSHDPDHMVIGQSPAMRQIAATVRKLAATPATVLIMGESGTGKELIARALHHQSPLRDEKFLAVNCAAIPRDLLENQLFGHRRGAYTGADRDMEGLFLSVGRGTLFLDEVAEMSLGTQAKLLRAIEQKEILPVGAADPVRVEARIVAATNKQLVSEVQEGRFREDLYYRLNVVSLTMPPLRDRREDLPELIDFLLAKQARALGKRRAEIAPDALRALIAAPWKGNVRELENALQRAVILSEKEVISLEDLPPDLVPSQALLPSEKLRDVMLFHERLHIERLLRACPDKKDAARRLGLSLSSLYRKIEELGIHLEDRRASLKETPTTSS